MGYDGKVVFKVDLDTKDFVPQIEQTKKELDDLLVEYEEFQKPLGAGTDTLMAGGKAAKYENEQLTKMAAKIQELANKYIDLKQKQDDVYKTNMKSVKNIAMMDNAAYNKVYTLQYNQLGTSMAKVSGQLPYVADGFKDIGKEAEDAGDEMEDAGKKGQKSGNDMSKGFSKGLKSVKRLALGIVGIRSAYMLARKAASSYMAQDEDLAKSMQSVWTGLGAFLAPLLETLTNLMLKFVGYLNVFIKALTGKDLIASANAKILEKQAKAQEKLNKATKEYQNYDFDVIRTQQTDKNKDSGIDESELINIPELNQNIVKKLQDLAHWLKENKDLIEEVGIALGITFGATAIANLLGNIGALIGSSTLMTGLLGLLAILGLIATVWVIKLVVDGIEDLKEDFKELIDDQEKLLGKGDEQHEDIMNAPEEEQQTETYQKKVEVAQGSKIDKYIENLEDAYDNYLKSHKGLFGLFTGENKDVLKKDADFLKQQVTNLIDFAKEGKLTIGGYKNLITFSKEYGDKIDWLNDLTDNYDINQQNLNEALLEYADIYPDLFSELMGFNNLSDEQQRELTDTTKKLITGKGNIIDYANAWKKIPSLVKTEAEAKTEKATELINRFEMTLFGIPKTTETKSVFNDKDATTTITKYEELLKKLGVPVTTTVKVDTSDADWKLNNLKSKLENIPGVGSMVSKLFSVLGVRGFASGGYISQPTFAMVGEGKYNEYVIPEGEDYISRLASEIGKYGSGSNTTNIYLDGRLIQRQVSKTNDRVSFTRNGR